MGRDSPSGWRRAARASVVMGAVLLPAACGSSEPLRGTGPAAATAVSETKAATGAWGRVLSAHQHRGGLDYAALAGDRSDLDTYLESLAEVDVEALGEVERLAFWINAYNAVVARHVLEHYPKLDSVKEVEGFFDRLTFPVAGAERTLDEIETRGRELGDPRIHFAVVCASTSCPDLRGEPYVPARLDAQLDEQTRAFLADSRKGLRYDAESDELRLSSIFKWYAGDFTGGSTVVAFFARGGVVDWILPYLPPDLAETLRRREPSVRYMDYDWSLNDRPGGS